MYNIVVRVYNVAFLPEILVIINLYTLKCATRLAFYTCIKGQTSLFFVNLLQTAPFSGANIGVTGFVRMLWVQNVT